jgi:hypothetical protein
MRRCARNRDWHLRAIALRARCNNAASLGSYTKHMETPAA